MSFTKFSKSIQLVNWELSDDNSAKINKTASTIPSFYISPGSVGTLDIKAALSKVADIYNISSDPQNYIYEAVRAVTAGVPNENGDAFSRDELLRFNHKLGCAVYQTFILKPHHVNHQASDPTKARGVILDAHYNDEQFPIEICPTCQIKTADRENRDYTGLYCSKCGTCVKDEFVEILIAVDKNKDPIFAEGVRTGSLNATSMGCSCLSTTCNVCDHIAYAVKDFCAHIKSGNKKKTFKTASGLDKIAFEWCNDVVFTEDSRVDNPADPKALQREILASTKSAQLESDEVGQDTQDSSKHDVSIEDYIEDKENNVSKSSLAELGIRVDNGSNNTSTIETFACIGHNSLDQLDKMLHRIASHNIMENSNMKKYRFRDAYKNLGIQAQIADNGDVKISNKIGELFIVKSEQPLTDLSARQEFCTNILRHIAAKGIVKTMNKYSIVQMPKIAQVLDKGVVDFVSGRSKGDTGPITSKGDTDMKSSRNKTPDTTLDTRVVDRSSKASTGKVDGLGGSGVTDNNTEDFEGGRDKAPDSTINESHFTQRESPDTKTLKDSIVDGIIVDHREKVAQKGVCPICDSISHPKYSPFCSQACFKMGTDTSKKAQMENLTDDELDKAFDEASSGKLVQDTAQVPPEPNDIVPPEPNDPNKVASCASTSKDKSKKQVEATKIATTINDEVKKVTSRLERLYKGRIAKLTTERDEKVTKVAEELSAKFKKCMRLAAARQKLNLEYSPIKAAFAEALLSPIDIGHDEYYPGMDEELVTIIAEKAADLGYTEFVDQLIDRAAELMKMSNETFTAFEADIDNLQPVMLPVQTNYMKQSNSALRKAACDGNQIVAPTSIDSVPDNRSRLNIRSALTNSIINKK
jgi:hypothetical protein